MEKSSGCLFHTQTNVIVSQITIFCCVFAGYPPELIQNFDLVQLTKPDTDLK